MTPSPHESHEVEPSKTTSDPVEECDVDYTPEQEENEGLSDNSASGPDSELIEVSLK